LQNDFAIILPSRVLKTGAQIEALGAPGARNVRHGERGEQGLASDARDGFVEGRRSDALTLEGAIDHEAPYADVEVGGWHGPQRLVVEHDDPGGRIAGIDGAIPSLFVEQ